MSLDGDECDDTSGSNADADQNRDAPFLDPMCPDDATVFSDSGVRTTSPDVLAATPGEHSDDALGLIPKMKPPLKHKSSNLSNDSGRSSSEEAYDPVPLTIMPLMAPFTSDDVPLDRRHSSADNTGHLVVPGGATCTITPPDSAYHNSESIHDESNSKTPKHTPQIMLSHSVDGMLPMPQVSAERRKSSPRLRRQPTRETQHLSISDGTGYVQLNQYKLKDEIGKVRRSQII